MPKTAMKHGGFRRGTALHMSFWNQRIGPPRWRVSHSKKALALDGQKCHDGLPLLFTMQSLQRKFVPGGVRRPLPLGPLSASQYFALPHMSTRC